VNDGGSYADLGASGNGNGMGEAEPVAAIERIVDRVLEAKYGLTPRKKPRAGAAAAGAPPAPTPGPAAGLFQRFNPQTGQVETDWVKISALVGLAAFAMKQFVRRRG